MSDSLVFFSCILLVGTLISSISQALLKKAAERDYPSIIAEYLNPLVILAYVMFFLTTLLCIAAYRVVPLSFGPVLESTSYIYVTVIGVLVFRERLTAKKVMALSIILLGIIVYAAGL